MLSHSRKGVSFLSRIIGSKKKEPLSEVEDEISDPEASRMSIDTSHPIGFIPRHPAPARYLRVRAHYKKDKAFDRVFLAQELEGIDDSQGAGKAIWALAFSKDGKYLAAAGQDRKVRVWAVITTPEEREAAAGNGEDAPPDGQGPQKLKAPVFQAKPLLVFEGHTGSILDLSWSKVCVPERLKVRSALTHCIEQLPPVLVHG